MFKVKTVQSVTFKPSQKDEAGNQTHSTVKICAFGPGRFDCEVWELPMHEAMALIAKTQKALLGRVIPWPDKQGLKYDLARVDWMRDGVANSEAKEEKAAKKKEKQSGKKRKRST